MQIFSVSMGLVLICSLCGCVTERSNRSSERSRRSRVDLDHPQIINVHNYRFVILNPIFTLLQDLDSVNFQLA